MFKKIFILTLLLLFFVSTTGLPLTIHFCNMAEKEMSDSCSMSNQENMMNISKEACHEKNSAEATISLEMQDCCKTELIVAKVNDSFISNNSETHVIFSTELSPVLEITNTLIPQIFTTNISIDTSPPPLQNNHIYLTNSILLI